MPVIETKHSLTDAEVSLLRSAIGQSITSIHCSGASQLDPYSAYECDDALNLQGSWDGYIAISGEFDETKIGETIHQIKIEKVQSPVTTTRVYSEKSSVQFFPVSLQPDFIIERLEVYGYSYQVTSANNKAEPFWQIEKEHPGQPIEEKIETENILLFHAKDGRGLLIMPLGAVPWFLVTFDDERIDQMVMQRNNEGSMVIKLKFSP